VIPIHPDLIKLGLLQRVAKIRDEGGGRLFPELPGATQDEISDLFQKRFAYWQKKTLGITEKGVSFHSFRHGFRDALREAGVPIDSTRALGGWARSGGVEERYGQGTRPSTLAKWMSEVSYEGLTLPSAATS
jgi:integrase